MSTLILDGKGLVVACPHCGQKNRIPYSNLGVGGQCGKCHHDLAALLSPIEIGSAVQFDALIQASPIPVIVDYWAPWCGPCRMVAPELEHVAAGAAGVWVVTKVNTEALPALGQRHGIQSIPTMAVFSRGHELARTSGARPAAAIRSFVQDALRAANPNP